MAGFRLSDKRTEPTPDRRLGIKLEDPDPARGLRGKLDAYLPPGAQYEYKPPSVFARYKVLTAVFIALTLGLASYCVLVLRRPPASLGRPASAPPAPQDQPIYIEPLPAK
jgi:hypothetical protein